MADANEQRNRRKRIKRMKTFIVSFIAIWMAVSIIALILLTIKVVSLQRQVNVLAANNSEYVQGVKGSSQNGTGQYVVDENALNSIDNIAGENDIPKVYLTFDDGPSENTAQILDVLDDYSIKATFFVIGKEDEELVPLYNRIVDEGHTLGMHSYTHKYSEIYASEEAFENDFNHIQSYLKNVTGVTPVYYRFPGGSSNQVSNMDMSEAIQFLNGKNVVYVDWNVASGDATTQAYTADELVENVMKDVVKYKTSVVLLHDSNSKIATVNALPKLIESLQGVGAEILPITEDTTNIQHVTVSEE